jgi:myo-inositol 2-dehydrogenase / D-chiro-inositol 1-dehydrogenase
MNSKWSHSSHSRRDFLKLSGGALAGAMVAGGLGQDARAAVRPTLKVGLIGCGGRGTGAARDCFEAGKILNVNIQVAALADVFQDRMTRSREALKGLGIEVPDDRCYLGFSAYRDVLAGDVDLVLLTTPANFHPPHFTAAVAAGKHVFMEKPAAVDPVGCREVIEAGEVAAQRNLSVVSGTQRRHEPGYISVAHAIADGAIGKILGGTIHFCLGGGGIGTKPANVPAWEWLVRRWGGWCQLSGDHIVEQHVHSIDVANWFMGSPPVRCVSFGARARRRGGNMYDFFSTDYEYPDDVHIHSMCRQIGGCWDRIGQSFRGEKGVAEVTGLVSSDRIYVGSADRKSPLALSRGPGHTNPFIQEHVNLIQSILDKKPINEARNLAESTLTAIMGRISAYNGQMVTWEEMMQSDLVCRPTAADFEAGTVEMPPEEAPLPGLRA